jgi:hypothetical protein
MFMNIRGYVDSILSSVKPKNNRTLIVFIFMGISVIIDSQIGIISDFIPEYISSLPGILLYGGLTVFLILSSFYIIYHVKSFEKITKVKYIHFKLVFSIIFISQILIAIMLTSIIIQFAIFQEYHITFLYIIHIISYGIWIGILGLLTRAFILWYKNFDKNILILIFTLAMMAYVGNGLFGLIYALDALSQQEPIISLGDVAYFPEFSNVAIGSQINLIYSGCSILAFVLTWIGSVKLLYRYLHRIGRFNFWSIMIVSLIYYNIEFPLFALGYLDPFGEANAFFNILLFSFSGILAGAIFGISFLSIARTMKMGSAVRTQLMLTAFGFLFFYITGSANATQAAYPPYGVLSVSLIGFSCYLIYSGLYTAAQTVSQDNALLRSIRKSVTEQANFLGGIGTAQRNNELESRVLKIAKNLEEEIEEKSGVESSLTENEVVDYVQYVINEMHGNKK